MKSDRTNQREKSHRLPCCVALLVSLSWWLDVALAPALAQQQEAVKTAPEPAPQQPPLTNWFNASTPGVRALARPGSFPDYDPPPFGICCPGRQHHSCIPRLMDWAFYCPKYRIISVANCCNSCQYKGVEHPYLYFLNPKCYEASGLRQTVCNECYRGSKDCGDCGAAGHCKHCADGAAASHP